MIKIIRQWLVEKRTKVGLTHDQLASLVGIKRQYYGMIENGERQPSVKVAMEIARVLDLDWTLFFEQKSNKTLLRNQSVS